jgi:hypothetical protein
MAQEEGDVSTGLLNINPRVGKGRKRKTKAKRTTRKRKTRRSQKK